MDRYDFNKTNKVISTKCAFTLAEVFNHSDNHRRTAFTLAEVFNHSDNHRKCAFTLAEVLIAMAIIGIVAAITIPALVNNFQQKSFIAAKAKFLNEVPQALTRYLTDRNMNNLAMTPFVTADGKGEFFSNYMKVVTNCGSNITDCFASDYQNTEGQALPIQPSAICNKAYSLKDNISVCITAQEGWNGQYYDERTKDNENYMAIYYDVNGKKKPNTLGRDYYEAYVLADGTIVDVVPAVKPSIIPSKAIDKYTLTVNSEGCESVGGAGTYAENSIVPIKVVPGDNKESSLAITSGNCTLDGSTVTMKNQNCTVNATCTAPVVPETPKYNLTVKNVGCESVTGDGLTTVNSGGSNTFQFIKNAIINLTVTPGVDKTSVIANECNTSNSTSSSITMPAKACTVTATCNEVATCGYEYWSTHAPTKVSTITINGRTFYKSYPYDSLTGLTPTECQTKKTTLGLKYCPFSSDSDSDKYAAAAAYCGGVKNLPTEKDMPYLAAYFSGTPYNTKTFRYNTAAFSMSQPMARCEGIYLVLGDEYVNGSNGTCSSRDDCKINTQFFIYDGSSLSYKYPINGRAVANNTYVICAK